MPLSKNDHEEKALMIRNHKNRIGSLELIDHVKKKKTDISKMDAPIQKMYKDICGDVDV